MPPARTTFLFYSHPLHLEQESIRDACNHPWASGIANLVFFRWSEDARGHLVRYLEQLFRSTPASFGIRLPQDVDPKLFELLSRTRCRQLETVVLTDPFRPLDTRLLTRTVHMVRAALPGRQLLVEVADLDEFALARELAVDGVVLLGSDGGLRRSRHSTLILLQAVLQRRDGLKVFAKGGIGIGSAAGFLAAGADGVVFES